MVAFLASPPAHHPVFHCLINHDNSMIVNLLDAISVSGCNLRPETVELCFIRPILASESDLPRGFGKHAQCRCIMKALFRFYTKTAFLHFAADRDYFGIYNIVYCVKYKLNKLHFHIHLNSLWKATTGNNHVMLNWKCAAYWLNFLQILHE